MNTEDLLKSLETGYLDKSTTSRDSLYPTVITNDKARGQKVLSWLSRDLDNCHQFWFAAAFLTTGGVAVLMNKLLEAQERGVKGKILVSQYQNFTQPEALRRLLKFENIELKIATDRDFHAKGFLFRFQDKFRIMIGSSNLTDRALTVNAEWNLQIAALPKSSIVHQALAEFELEFARAQQVDEDFIASYEALYNLQLTFQNQEPIRLATSDSAEELADDLDPNSDYETDPEFGIELTGPEPTYLGQNYNQASQSVAEPSTTVLHPSTTGPVDSRVKPNEMQREALANLRSLRSSGKTKALLISATGTGKTFLSAFDAEQFEAQRLLFVVHRTNIARAALRSFRTILGKRKSYGLYTGGGKNTKTDFVFATVQSLARAKNLGEFSPETFDYIVVDETHRAGADTYSQVMNYFRPKFLLGMTATPERTDGKDIYSLFDHTIAYEIRLQQALEEEMLAPFHYFGVTEVVVEGQSIDDKTAFGLLVSDSRVNHIIEKIRLYGCDDGEVRGLVFCSRVEECVALSEAFNQRGFKTVALTGSSTEDERSRSIDRLELPAGPDKLDYIFTVDIFNEGVDIPRVNQVVMLRPTQSAIIFVQQLGRGLRKIAGKQYLTVIDFIGNYDNNYLVPVALYGDTSYNKDFLRKSLASGSALIPGASTVNFDRIAKERIFASIDSANLRKRSDLVNDFDLLRFRLGRRPMMTDFTEHGSRDALLYVEYSKSYFNFVESVEDSLKGALTKHQKKVLELVANEIADGSRPHEPIILLEILRNGRIGKQTLSTILASRYDMRLTESDVESALRNLNFHFVREQSEKVLVPAGKLLGHGLVDFENDVFTFSKELVSMLAIGIFSEFFFDNLKFALLRFAEGYEARNYRSGFVLYRKYSRKDVFRLLNWAENPVAQNVGGYIVSEDRSNCPIFVTYDKGEEISESIRYDDRFISPAEFQSMSKNRRTLGSPDVRAIRDEDRTGIRLPLFIKKSDDEGLDFYYISDLVPIPEKFEETKISAGADGSVSIVAMHFRLVDPLEQSLYDYLTVQATS